MELKDAQGCRCYWNVESILEYLTTRKIVCSRRLGGCAVTPPTASLLPTYVGPYIQSAAYASLLLDIFVHL